MSYFDIVDEQYKWGSPIQQSRAGECTMVTKGLLVRMEAKHGKDTEVEALLLSALAMVQQESSTTAWFAIRFGRAANGIFDAFPDEESREKHLSGPVATALLG